MAGCCGFTRARQFQRPIDRLAETELGRRVAGPLGAYRWLSTEVGYNVRLVSDPANAAGIPEQAPPSTAESLAAGHEVVVEDGGPFTVARCTCGWYTPARRSRPLARGEAADHLRLHGLLP